MRNSLITLFLLGILSVPHLALAQEQAQTYSGFNRFTDDVKLAFSGGDDKVRLALEVREKEIDSAISNSQNQNEKDAIKNLERAHKKLQIIQEKVSLDTSEEVKSSVDEITNKINKEENLPNEFEEYLLEEERTQLTAELTEKTFEYCKELAKEGYEEMLKEEVCNPDTAAPGLENELKELKDIQIKLFVQLMLGIRSCIDDPGTCNCDEVIDIEQKTKCEKMVALAIKCEYKEDETSCDELEAMRPVPEDSFATSFVPDFLMNLFRKKSDMIEYDLNHSDGVPEECWDDNDKPECKKYADLKETNLDWDEYGNFIGTNRAKGAKETIPTIQESVPECYDEEGNFLKEKCGEITVIWTEDGLINYVVEKQIDDIINDFENKSEQYTIDVNETDMQIQVQNKVMEIKKEMNQINNQIVNITYAARTGSGGGSGVVIEGDEQGVVTDVGGDTIVDNVVVNDGGSSGGYAPGTSGGASGDTTVSDDVVTVDIIESGTVDHGTVDNAGGDDISGGSSGNEVSGVDEGSGEPGVIDED